MFGQDDTQDDTTQAPTTIEPSDDVTNDITEEAAVDSGTTADAAPASVAESNEEEAALSPDSATDESAGSPDSNVSDEDKPADDTPADMPLSSTTSTASDELLEVKKEALTDLAPLIDHLDQPPEEQFKTVMMLIQATDDPTHVKAAYDSAKKISDETARAQALLDVVNEINYFTQKS